MLLSESEVKESLMEESGESVIEDSDSESEIKRPPDIIADAYKISKKDHLTMNAEYLPLKTLNRVDSESRQEPYL